MRSSEWSSEVCSSEIDNTKVEISPGKRDMFLTMGVTEGEIYKVSSVELTGDTVLPKESVERMVLVKPDHTFSRALLNLTSNPIVATLVNIGYAFAKVNMIPDIDRENRTVAIQIQVIPVPRVNVRRVIGRAHV